MTKTSKIKDISDLIQGRIRNKTITIPKGKYRVKETIVVSRNGKLIIEPGTKLLFANNTGIIVHKGILIAEGTKEEKITFKPAKGEEWQNITFVDSKSDENRLEYCIIKGGNGINPFNRYISHQLAEQSKYKEWDWIENYIIGGGIAIINSSPTIKHCKIKDSTNCLISGGGIYCFNSSSIIDKCTIENCAGLSGSGIYCAWHSSVTIKNCKIMNNTSDYGTITSADSITTIENCDIGKSAKGNCNIYSKENSTLIIKNSNITSAESHAIWNHYPESKIIVENCNFTSHKPSSTISMQKGGSLKIKNSNINGKKITSKNDINIYDGNPEIIIE